MPKKLQPSQESRQVVGQARSQEGLVEALQQLPVSERARFVITDALGPTDGESWLKRIIAKASKK